MIIGFDASRAFAQQPGGTENYSREILRSMIGAGGENEFLVYTRGVTPFKGASFKGSVVRVQRIGWPRLWTQGGLARRTWVDRMDVLFIPAHTLPVLRRPSLPTVVTIHGLEYEYLPGYYRFPQRLSLTWSTRYALRAATRLIAVSRFTAHELETRLGADPDKIRVVQEGVDIQVYGKSYSDNEKHSILSALGVGKPYILFIGVVQPRKNLERLIEAFSRVVLAGTIPAGPEALSPSQEALRAGGWAGGPVNLSLVIAGKLGWMYQGILAAPKRFGVEERVKFLGFVEEGAVPVLLQEAELYVQPSLNEGFGLPVLEAMAAGTPVVAAAAGALPEVVGQAGLLVDPRSPEKMGEAILTLLTSQNLARTLVSRGLARVRQFSWKRAAEETLAVLGEAAGREA